MREEKEKPKEKEKEKDPPKKEEKDKKKGEEKCAKTPTAKPLFYPAFQDAEETEMSAKSPTYKSKKEDPFMLYTKRKGFVKLNVGSILKTDNNVFAIEKALAIGAFGHVYKVSLMGNNKQLYALKTEFRDTSMKTQISLLKVELAVLNEIHSSKLRNKECFAELIDRGRTETFIFHVTQLLSHSISDILVVMCNRKMPHLTAVYLMWATLYAIDALHVAGFVHRDISIHNFAVGHWPKERQVYIIGFGIARKYVDSKGVPIFPREKVSFIGSLRYCSRGCHEEKERSRKDDLESWAYMCLEFFHVDNISWRRCKTREEVYNMKKNLFSTLDQNKLKVSHTFIDIMKEIDNMNYFSARPYMISDMVNKGMLTNKLWNPENKLVWETSVMPVTRLKKKGEMNRVQNDEDSGEKKRREERKKRKAIVNERKKVEHELLMVMREIDGRDPPPNQKIRRKKRGPAIDSLVEGENDDDGDSDDDEDDSSEGEMIGRRKENRAETPKMTGKKGRRVVQPHLTVTERTYEDVRDKYGGQSRNRGNKKERRQPSRNRTVDKEEKTRDRSPTDRGREKDNRHITIGNGTLAEKTEEEGGRRAEKKEGSAEPISTTIAEATSEGDQKIYKI